MDKTARRGLGYSHGSGLVFWRRNALFLAGLLVLLAFLPSALAQRQMEPLGRGVVAVRFGNSQAYVGWRLLGSDPDDIGFNLYRVANGVTNQLNGTTPLTNRTDYLDTSANFTQTNSYFVRPVLGGVEQAPSALFTLPANAPVRPYLEVPIQPPAGGVSPDGVAYTYSANDCSVGDLDGDGEYELVLKWDPSNSKDNSLSGYTGNVFLDAYKLNGTRLWRLDLGRNIRAGAHYTQFMVYDLDGDGRSEVACKTAPGTVDGLGNSVLLPGDSASADYRNSSGYILSGPEYLTIFDGSSGAALATTNYVPARGSVSSWGDSYGNRVDRFLACVAYLDGVRPSLVMCRGYYTRAVLAAWEWRGGKLTQRWVFDSNSSGNSAYAGQGNHNLTVADVDHDGKDEIIYGACAISHDGTGLYSTGLGHGDALHVSDMDPDRPGLEVWDVHETPSSAGGGELRDAQTGQLLFGYLGTDDTGRGLAEHIDGTRRGFQLWSTSTDGVYDIHGTRLTTSRPSINFAIWWDADLAREVLDGSNNDGGSTSAPHIDKWNGSGTTTLLSATGCYANNSTKATPALTADILGDWREEAIWRSADSQTLRIYLSTIQATNRFYTFMHDPQYRLSIAWQNTAYNQPPHTSFYVGADMYPPPAAPISSARLAWRGSLTNNAWDAGASANWITNNLWTLPSVSTGFRNSDTVLFDSTGTNKLPVLLAGALSPAAVTVYSPGNYTFGGTGSLVGTMSLLKAGAGTLTVNTTNSYTGATSVRDGWLVVNGRLDQSPVTAWGNGWGGAGVGGGGCLGKGLTLQPGSLVAPGLSSNAPGALTISNSLVELGGVVNEFHLSDDPTGLFKTNDLFRVFGNVRLAGTNVIAIQPVTGTLGIGTYTLFTYSGTLTGGLTNFVLSGLPSVKATLVNSGGSIALNIASLPANLVWRGGVTNNWDVESSSNWLNGASAAAFHQGDFVRFDDSGATNPSVNLVGGLAPTSVTVDAAANYSFNGSGSLGGGSSLLKTNSGTLTILTTNTFTGPTILGGGTLVVTSLHNGAQAGSLGLASGDPTNLVFCGGTLRFSGSTAGVSCGATLNAGGGTLDIPAPGTTLTLSNQVITGSGGLTKSGNGVLSLTADNSFAGGVTLCAGTLSLGSVLSAGSGTCTLSGGTLALNVPGSPAVIANPLLVAADSFITSPGSGNNNEALSGSWSGASTVYISTGSGGTFSVRGSMSTFSGNLVLTGAGTFRFYGSAGSSAAGFDLGAGTAVMLTRDGGTVNLGALTGGPATMLRGAASSAVLTTFNIGGKGADATFAGTIADGSKAATAITKVGAGTWTLTSANTYTGPTVVTAGTLALAHADGVKLSPSVSLSSGARLDVSGTTNGAFTLSSGQTLSGSGSILGNVIAGSGSTIAPGNSSNILAFSNNLTCVAGSRLLLEISQAPLTNSQLQVAGLLTLGGALVVTNSGTVSLAEGDTFSLFRGGNLAGQVASLSLPVLPSGLAWDTRGLATTGLLRVKADVLQINATALGPQGVVFSVSGGIPGGVGYIVTTTNLSLPAFSWTPLTTNVFDLTGSFQVTNALDSALPLQFYRLYVP